MAKISAHGDVAAITLRKPNGGRVVVTRNGRLLAQPTKGSGYVLVDPHWVMRGSAADPKYRDSIARYLIANSYPGAMVL